MDRWIVKPVLMKCVTSVGKMVTTLVLPNTHVDWYVTCTCSLMGVFIVHILAS